MQKETGIDPHGSMLVVDDGCGLCVGSMQYGWPQILSKNPGENTVPCIMWSYLWYQPNDIPEGPAVHPTPASSPWLQL